MCCELTTWYWLSLLDTYPPLPYTCTKDPSHLPWVRKREPPLRKAAPPLGENALGEALRDFRVLTREALNLCRQQRLSCLSDTETKKTQSGTTALQGLIQPFMGRLSTGQPGFLLTLITRGRSLSKILGVSSGSVTLRGRIWAQTVQLAGMGSDSFCSQLFDDQGSKSERKRQRADRNRRTGGEPSSPGTKEDRRAAVSCGDLCEVWRLGFWEGGFSSYAFLHLVGRLSTHTCIVFLKPMPLWSLTVAPSIQLHCFRSLT